MAPSSSVAPGPSHLWAAGSVQTITPAGNGTGLVWYRFTPRGALVGVELGRRVERALIHENATRYA